jgi:hypothetical protein
VVEIFRDDYHSNKDVTQTSLIEELQLDFTKLEQAGPVKPRWDRSGRFVHEDDDSPYSKTSCKRLLTLLKSGRLIDPNADRVRTLYNGLEHIPTDAISVLEAVTEIGVVSKEFYEQPLLLGIPKIHDIHRSSSTGRKNSSPPTVHISIGIYASRNLFDVMTQQLQVIMAAMDDETVHVTQKLSHPPCLPPADQEPVFASDPNGPKVHFDFDEEEDDINGSDDGEDGEGRDKKKHREDGPKTPGNFEDTDATDGTLDAFKPSGFLKLIENTGTSMESFDSIKEKLGDKLQIKLMLHQEHALSFMYKMEHLEGGLNSLIWEERSFLEGGRYFYSPVLGQLRLSLGSQANPVRGGILADEVSLQTDVSNCFRLCACHSSLFVSFLSDGLGQDSMLRFAYPGLFDRGQGGDEKEEGPILVGDVDYRPTGKIQDQTHFILTGCSTPASKRLMDNNCFCFFFVSSLCCTGAPISMD